MGAAQTSPRPRGALDLDDTLYPSYEGLIAYFNEKHGTSFTSEDAYRHPKGLMGIWQCSHTEMWDRYHFFQTLDHSHIRPYTGAVEVVGRLRHFFALDIVTARTDNLYRVGTQRYVAEAFPGLISGIHMATYPERDASEPVRSKVEIMLELGSEFFIENKRELVIAAAEAGIPSVLFGCTADNTKPGLLPRNAIQVSGWSSVEWGLSQIMVDFPYSVSA